jgi:ribonuclease P protein component
VHANDARPSRTGRLTRSQRLRRPQEFAAVLAARGGASMRATGNRLSMTAAWSAAADVRPTRLGITVGKRMARRSIDRALVKRIVREAFRHVAPTLDRAAAGAGVAVDVSVRLKAPLGEPGSPLRPALAVLRRGLRADVDELLQALIGRVGTIDAHA